MDVASVETWIRRHGSIDIMSITTRISIALRKRGYVRYVLPSGSIIVSTRETAAKNPTWKELAI